MFVTTHANAPTSPWSLLSALDYLEPLLSSPGFQVLAATAGHARVFAQTAKEHAPVEGLGTAIHDVCKPFNDIELELPATRTDARTAVLRTRQWRLWWPIPISFRS